VTERLTDSLIHLLIHIRVSQSHVANISDRLNSNDEVISGFDLWQKLAIYI